MPELLLSVIIPVGPDEKEIPPGLIDDLHFLPQASELVFVGCDPQQQALQENLSEQFPLYRSRWLYAEPGRAQQMNAGATAAEGKFLWFLHLDSRFQPQLLDRLILNLQNKPDRLHYCLLKFLPDGPVDMGLNALGANLRSLLLGVPFGDQGFAICKEQFERIGGYPERVAYGEDHLFVWYARQQGIGFLCCFEYLQTSARKYKKRGWWSLTLLYQQLWIKQAWPEFIKLLRRRYF